VKFDNVLVGLGEDGTDILKTGDFGLAGCISAGQMRESIGTLNYASPQVLREEQYTSATDLWSLGVICFTMMTGCMPFNGGTDHEVGDRIRSGDLAFSPESTVSEAARKFVMCFLQVEEELRPTVDQAVNDKWMRGRLSGKSPKSTIF
jgi:serine/threonine protein kinase